MDFVALETIRELQKRNDDNHYFVIVAPGEDRCLEESTNLSIIELKCPTYPLWEQVALPRAVKRLKVDILHCTSNTAPLRCPVPLVLTLHDIIYLEPRQHRSSSLYQEMGWHYRRLVVPRILKKCKKIITVSKFECNRIRQALQIPSERITAIYNGYSTHFHQQSDINMEIVQKYIPQKDFLFFLGNTDPKKNAARTLKAYSLYLQQSSVKRPLLIADLKEEYIDSLLQQEDLTDIKSSCIIPATLLTMICRHSIMLPSLSSTLRSVRVLEFRCWRRWRAVRLSLPETRPPCPKWQDRVPWLWILTNRKKSLTPC